MTKETQALDPVEMVDDVTLLNRLIGEAEAAKAEAEAKLESMSITWPDFRTVNAFQLSVIANNFYANRKQLQIESEDYVNVLDYLRFELRKATAGVEAAEVEKRIKEAIAAAQAETDPLKRVAMLTKLAGVVSETGGVQ